ncbi:MAG TPA: response regulator [Polyangiaceae bacterium]|nr:response regulator [Polyangiaceae bacterium]
MAIIATPGRGMPAFRPNVDGGLVWVLEDSPLEAEMARRAISTSHTVEIFPDSPAMLERIANGSRPDALILDCQLPTMPGLEVCRFLRESFDEMDLPILMLTVQGHRADLIDGLGAGANDYLTKPYSVAELLARVSTLVRTRHLHRARAQRAREVALTAEVGAMLTRGPESAAQLCVDAIGRHFEAAVVGVWTLGFDGRLELTALFGSLPRASLSVPHEKGDTRQPVVHVDEATNELVADEGWRSTRRRTFVETALVVESRFVGALSLGVRRRLGAEEVEVVSTLADLLALGLERMRAERERAAILLLEQRARAEAEAANRTKDEFLAMLSHELRGPLNAISGWVHMLRSGTVPANDTQRALATIQRNAVAQTQLVEDLLDVSRIVSGKLTIDSVPVDLAEAVEGVVESLRPVAADKKLTLVARVDRVGDVRGDPARLRQVTTNLLVNAMKFTPAGGRVTVSVHHEGNVGILRVEDTGQGIDASFLPHVFERFRQADGSTARKHGGLGLGLAIVHHIAGLHGGSVAADSAGPGKGAVFTVRLPLVSAESCAPSSATRSVQPSNLQCENLKVVVVDDEADARELVAKVLTECGATVRMAGGVDEALAFVAAETPHVIVTDLGMPGENGFALLLRLRALAPAPAGLTPVIALTAYARPENRQAALTAGFDHFLTKPFEFEELIAAVSRLGRNPPRRA